MSAIEWTDRTWNPVRGCSRVSEGCRNCYAERMAGRYSSPGLAFEGFARRGAVAMSTIPGEAGRRYSRWTGRVELIPSKLDKPLRWRKPRRVFVNSMSDLFHDALPDEGIDLVFAVMALAPRHTFQILTKRPERMLRYMTGANANGDGVACRIAEASKAQSQSIRPFALPSEAVFDAARVARGEPWRFVSVAWPLPNVWLGVSVENQAAADERIPLLLQTPAAVRFCSYEPGLDGVDFTAALSGNPERTHERTYVSREMAADAGDPSMEGSLYQDEEWEKTTQRIDWLIIGGESGPGARPFDLAWARSVRDQCRAAGVAFFYKPGGHSNRCEHSAKGGCLECIPKDLRIREFPR